MVKRQVIVPLAICLALGLAACESDGKTVYPEDDNRKSTGSMYEERSSVFGEGGLNILGGDEAVPDTGGGGIGVNSYLWRASLDSPGVAHPLFTTNATFAIIDAFDPFATLTSVIGGANRGVGVGDQLPVGLAAIG